MKTAVYLIVVRATDRAYIGVSFDPIRRLSQHRLNYRETALGADLSRHAFDLHVRWYPDRRTARAREAAWIARARQLGVRLYNQKDEAAACPWPMWPSPFS